MAINYPHCPLPPCWLTKCQREQAIALQRIGFECIDLDDLFEVPDFEGLEKIEDWTFRADFPRKPDEFDDYPNVKDYEIYAHCNGAIFIYYESSEVQNFQEAEDGFNEITGDFESAKYLIKSISEKYSAHVNQLCLV